MTAKEFLQEKGIHPTEPIYWDLKDTTISLDELMQEYTDKQLLIQRVVSSSDKIVIELSDEELQIVTRQELSKMQDDAMEFDGFEGWIVRGKLAIIK